MSRGTGEIVPLKFLSSGLACPARYYIGFYPVWEGGKLVRYELSR